MNNLYDITESSLDYSLYLAENELVRSLAIIDNKAKYVTEAEEYKVLNESLKNVINTYLTKVVNSITQAFNKFKTGLVDKSLLATQKLINDNRDLLNTDFKMLYPDEFEVPDIDSWNNNVYAQINTVFPEFTEGNYASWKQSGALESSDAFIKHNYPDLSALGDPKNSLIDNIKAAVFKPGKGQQANSTNIDKFADFLTEYKTQVENISKQLEKVNNTNRNIETYLSKIEATGESYIGSDRILSYICEADDNTGNETPAPEPPKINTDVNNKFRDESDPSGEKAKKENPNQDRKNIVNFFKANTRVLTIEMRTCNDVRKACQKILTNYINLQLKKKGVKTNNTQPAENTEENRSADVSVAQVDTSVPENNG